jgi:hypothetical protein
MKLGCDIYRGRRGEYTEEDSKPRRDVVKTAFPQTRK